MTLLTFPTFDSTHFNDFPHYRLLKNLTIDNRELTKNEAQFAFNSRLHRSAKAFFADRSQGGAASGRPNGTAF